MSSRPPAPGRSLAERFPTVAATWDHEANGELTPADVAAAAGILVHWRCAADHTWSEKVAQRTQTAQWKEGNIAACRLCTGAYVEIAFNCGHTLTVIAWRATPGDRPCPDCRQAEYQRKQSAYERDKERILGECRAEVGPLTDTIWAERGYEEIPAPLRTRARSQLRTALIYSLVGVRAFDAEMVSPKLLATLCELDGLRESLPAETDGPALILEQVFWARALTPTPAPPAAPEPATLAALEAAAREGFALPLPAFSEDEVRERTWLITSLLREWAHRNGWRPYRELRVPLADERDLGRLDLVVFRPGLPELAIEIDSQNVPRSIAKLELARDLGALPVWIRWNEGIARTIDGVHVVDLTRFGCADAA